LLRDEIDAIRRQHGPALGFGKDGHEQALHLLPADMDGFDSREEVIEMAATNLSDVLKSAILRPGRFPREIEIDLRALQSRKEI
jgi:cell division protease FtsH